MTHALSPVSQASPHRSPIRIITILLNDNDNDFKIAQ